MIEQEIRTVWQGYQLHVEHLNPVLEAMSLRGIPVNALKLEAFGRDMDKLKEESYTRLCALYPLELLPSTQAQGLVKPPVDTTGLLQREFNCDVVLYETLSEACSCKKGCKKCNKTGRVTKRVKAGSIPGRELRWYKPKPFKPSSTQVGAYIQHKKYKPPTRAVKKGEPGSEGKREKATTDRTALETLYRQTGDEFFQLVLRYRNYEKLRSTYVGDSPDTISEKLKKGQRPLRGWQPYADGRVHPNFLFRPATGQLSSTGPNCFSADTEILTKRGWVKFPDLMPWSDQVAQFDKETRAIDFVTPTAWIRNEFQGELVQVTTEQQLDALMTPDHSCLLQNRKTGDFRNFAAVNYPEDYRQFQAGHYVGGERFVPLAEIVLWAALQADGHINGPRCGLTFGLTKQRKKDRLSWALTELGLQFNRRANLATMPEHEVFTIPAGQLDSGVWVGRKNFSPEILELNPTSFRWLSGEVWFWDGVADRRSMFSSSIKSNTDWVQILTILSGRRAKVRQYHNGNTNSWQNWIVDASGSCYSGTTNRAISRISYNGYVYCVTMPKGTIIVRRNGKSFITNNCQNAIGEKSGELGVRFRSCIESRPGRTLLNFDWTGLHAYMLGFLAKDPTYMRLSRLGIHDFVAANILKRELPRHIEGLEGRKKDATIEALVRTGLPTGQSELHDFCDFVAGCDTWLSHSDSELATQLGWVKKHAKVYRSKVKPAVHGYGFGIGAFKLTKTYPDSFENTKEAQSIIDMLNALFPLVAQYREDIKKIADEQGFLVNPFGYIRHFHSVFDKRPVSPDYLPRWGEKLYRNGGDRLYRIAPGMDAEKAIAFLPASCSFGYKKDVMLDLADSGLDERYYMINEVHDSLEFECPDELVDEALGVVLDFMQRPNRCLVNELAPDGLSCPAGVSIGRNAGAMKEVH